MSIGKLTRTGLCAGVLLALILNAWAQAPVIEPPRVQLVDRNHVNMVSGSLNLSLTDLSIGAEGLGLTHTISSYGSYFHGFSETYIGSIYTAYLTIDTAGAIKTVMRVSTGEAITDFEINGNSYTSLSNAQHRLVKTGSTHVYTSPDGTEYTYTASGTSSADMLQEVKYPNGFTVTIHRGTNSAGKTYRSVTTNNGLQFKYVFNEQTGNGWSSSVPTQIVAINNAFEGCSPTATSCNLSRDWPAVTYQWSPGGMPTSLYQVPTVFRVTDAIGRVVEYYHELFDRFEGAAGPIGQHFVPRVVRIKDALSNDDVTTIEYEYGNVTGWSNEHGSSYMTVLEEAVIEKARVQNEQWTYTVHNQSPTGYGSPEVWKSARGYDAIRRVRVNKLRSLPTLIETDHQTINLSSGYDNRVNSIVYPEGNRVTFGYDDRGRLTSRIQSSGSNSGPDDISILAGYPSGCPNRKTCNKPLWVEDGRGNRTEYTYHSASGQIATVTGPADRNGIRPRTYYSYEEHYAWYKNSNGSLRRADSPIWLLTQERTCRTSASTSSGCQGGASDLVITEYEYGPDNEPNNLFLRGVAVTADGQTRRTCYQYDPYGNRIGEIQPKAGLAQCP